MQISSLTASRNYHPDKPSVELLMETDFTKEIRILFRAGQLMKSHQTPFPIIVEIVEGQIDFGVAGEKRLLKAGDLISLAGNVPHDLSAQSDSLVRLTLAKGDRSERVREVATQNS